MDPQNTIPASTIRLVLAYATLYLVWGSTYLAIRVVVETIPPFFMASMRFFAAGMALSVYVAMTSGFKMNRQQFRDNAIIAALLLLGGTGIVSWAEKSIPSGITTLIVSLNPIFTVLADWAFLRWSGDRTPGKAPNLFTFLGLFLGIVGLAILVGPSLFEEGATHLDLFPVIALMVACMFWTIGSLYSRYARNPVEPLAGSAVQMLMGGVWILLMSFGVGELGTLEVEKFSMPSILAWLYLVIAGSLLAFTTYLWLMKHSSPTMVSTYAYINPIVAVFLGWWLLNEPLNARIFLAAAIIISGVALMTIAKGRALAKQKKADAEEVAKR